MAMVENYSKSEQNAYEKQKPDMAKEKARLAEIEQRMMAKMKDAGSKPLPRRGDVKKRIAKDLKDALKGYVDTLKNTFAADRVHDRSVLVSKGNSK